MSDNLNVLLVGPGYMGQEYCKVLKAQGYNPIVIGRGEEKAKAFKNETGIDVITGGIEEGLKKLESIPEYAIIATSVESLAQNCILAIKHGVKYILLEKPGAITYTDMKSIVDTAEEYEAEVFIAYNRRFYASTEEALNIIREDGGVRDFHFEFTEWGSTMGKIALTQSEAYREAVFISNSTHVVDLAFFLGGVPKQIHCLVKEDSELEWHKSGCIYAGAGITDKGALFSYQADWNAPGRWSLEVITKYHRLYFKPMEELHIQEIESVVVSKKEIKDELDKKFKPGLYKQTESFLKSIDDGKKVTIHEQLEHMRIYLKMENKEIV